MWHGGICTPTLQAVIVLRPQPKTKTEAPSQSCQAPPCQPWGTGFSHTSLRLPASTLTLGLPGPSLLALPPPTATCVYNPEAPSLGLGRLVPASAQPNSWGNRLPLDEIQEASALPASNSESAGTERRACSCPDVRVVVPFSRRSEAEWHSPQTQQSGGPALLAPIWGLFLQSLKFPPSPDPSSQQCCQPLLLNLSPSRRERTWDPPAPPQTQTQDTHTHPTERSQDQPQPQGRTGSRTVSLERHQTSLAGSRGFL